MRRRCNLVGARFTATLLAACAEANNGLSPTTPIAVALRSTLRLGLNSKGRERS